MLITAKAAKSSSPFTIILVFSLIYRSGDRSALGLILIFSIIFTLIILGLKGINIPTAKYVVNIVDEYHIIYNLTLFIALFTFLTGITYLYDNRATIVKFISRDGFSN